MAKICFFDISSKFNRWAGPVVLLAMLAGSGTFLWSAVSPVAAAEQMAATAWVNKDRYARARLLAGSVAVGKQDAQVFAAVQIGLAEGWKTYWRTTGDAAGAPPYFDFKGSVNVAKADVLYPAPHRFKTPDGDSIGYKKNVTFPIRLTAKDAARPMTVKLKFFYGVCAEICIPAEVKFNVTVNGAALAQLRDGPLVSALAEVPGIRKTRAAKDPVIKTVRADGLDGKTPRVLIDVDYPGGLTGADLFVEGPDEAFVPQPQRLGKPSGNLVRYVINLSHGGDMTELKGKPLRLTLVSKAGQAEVNWVLK